MGDAHVGLLPRLMSKALRKLSGVASKSKSCIIFTNQIRQKIGVMFGNPETTPGGLALKFHASVRLEIRRAETLKEGNEMVGNRIRVKVAKNKVAPPFTQAEFEMTFGEGISKLGDLLDVATDQDIISKSGAWFSYNNERLGQGRNSAKEFLIEHPEIIEEVETKVRENLGIYAQSAPASIAGVDSDASAKKSGRSAAVRGYWLPSAAVPPAAVFRRCGTLPTTRPTARRSTPAPSISSRWRLRQRLRSM